MNDSVKSAQKLGLNVEGILNVSRSLFSDLDKKGSSSVIKEDEKTKEIQELDKKLYPIQKSVFKKMLEHIKKSGNPDMLMDIATGFGKSFIQISFAGILEHASTDYRIAVPDNLVSQFKNDVDKFFSDKTAEQIKSKIKGHKEFFISNWQETQQLPKSTFLMIDEVDSATKEDLYRQRFKLLEDKYPCVSLSATSQEWLYKSVKKAQGEVISISLEEKIKEMGIIPAHSINATANSVMKRTNKRSGFLPYACVMVTLYLLTLLFKIYLNSYTIEGFVYLSTLYNFYNFYLNTFIYHPIIGQISLIIIAFPILSLINLIVNKIADRDIFGRFIANLVGVKASSPAHEDVCKIEETFVHKKVGPDHKDTDVQSPRGKKALILASHYNVIKNLNLIYRDEKNEVYKNGKWLNYSETHDQYKLGKDFGEKYDFSYKESQRNYCIMQCKEEIRRSNPRLNRGQIDKIVSGIDFSNTAVYSEYRVMHGIINSALLALLQECHDDKGNKKYDNVIALNKARAEKLDELLKDVEGALESNKESGEYVRKYLEDKGFQGELLTEMTENIEFIIGALNTNLHPIVKNWELDRKLHNMMKIGDEYQVLDGLCDEFKKITESTPGHTSLAARFRSNHPKFHDFSDDYFDDVYKAQLERYLEKKFGLKNGEFIEEMYDALQSQNYPALALLFRKHNLIEKINASENKFPLHKLREICEKNKIIFDNLYNLKINGLFTGFDGPEKLRACQYTKEEVTKLFTEGWVGTLVDPSKSTGFSDPTLQNVAIIIGESDDEINNPDKIYQSYGRNRGLDKTQQPFFRMIKRKGVSLCFDVKRLTAKDIIPLLFKARKEYNERLLKTIRTEISEEIILHISDNEEINDKFCNDLVVKKLTDLYDRNDHDLEKTQEGFSCVLEGVKKDLTSCKKNIKSQGKPSVLYVVPYYILYLVSQILYYSWALPSYLIFCLNTIGIDKVIGGVASAEATYVHIIKNYTFAGSIKNQKVVEKFLELSEGKDKSFTKLLNSSICRKALENIISPLKDEHIEAILKSIYPEKNNGDKVRKIRSLLNGIKNKEEIKTDKETINLILEISKEIVADHAWYHDSSDIVGVELPKLKNDNSIFYTSAGDVKNQKTIEKFLERSEGEDGLCIINISAYKKALKNIISPLNYGDIKAILDSIYLNGDNDDKVKKILSLLNEIENKEKIKVGKVRKILLLFCFCGIKNKEEIKTDKETINLILEISKEIVAARARYKVFYIRNVGNAGKFFPSFFCKSDGKFSLNNEEGKEYRKNYGNTGLQTFIFFIKWFPLLVVFPQVPYLCTDNVKIASAISTIVICIPLMAFIFGCPEWFRSIIFNKQIAACNELELIANQEKVPFIKKASETIESKVRSRLANIKPFTKYDIEHGNGEYTNPIQLNLATLSSNADNCVASRCT